MTSIYNAPKNIDKSEFLTILTSGIITLICEAIVSSVYSIDDYNWLLKQYELLLKHPSLEIRRVTVTCIGHLARMNKNANKDELLSILDLLLSDNDLIGLVEDAIDDVNTFL